jgi:TonB family protein
MRLTWSLRALVGLTLAWAAPRAAAAQTIAGLVIDSASRLPTRLLAVHVLGDSGRTVVETRTDTTGVFYAMLPAAGAYRVRFALDSTTTFESDTIRVPGDAFVQRKFVVALPRPLFGFEVEKQVQQRRGQEGPRYPAAMLQANVEGEVLVQFVVDSTGMPRLGTLRILRSTNSHFEEAVRVWLPTARFYPAELRGRHVAQMVQQPFTFALDPSAPPRPGFVPTPDDSRPMVFPPPRRPPLR